MQHHGAAAQPGAQQLGGDGIKRLLAAESGAAQVVAEARKAKSERLKHAKAEAEREIAAYRAEREGAYQKKLAETTRGAAETSARLEAGAELSVRQVHADVAAGKDAVVAMMVRLVTSVGGASANGAAA